MKMLEIRRDDDLDWVYAQDYLHCQLWRQSTCLPLTDLYRDSMGQSHDDVPLEIDIRHAFEVSTTTRTTKEDVTPSHIVAVSSSGETRLPIAATGLTRRPVHTYRTVQG